MRGETTGREERQDPSQMDQQYIEHLILSSQDVAIPRWLLVVILLIDIISRCSSNYHLSQTNREPELKS